MVSSTTNIATCSSFSYVNFSLLRFANVSSANTKLLHQLQSSLRKTFLKRTANCKTNTSSELCLQFFTRETRLVPPFNSFFLSLSISPSFVVQLHGGCKFHGGSFAVRHRNTSRQSEETARWCSFLKIALQGSRYFIVISCFAITKTFAH